MKLKTIYRFPIIISALLAMLGLATVAQAAVPMVNSAKITSPNQITIVFSEPVNTSKADYFNFTGGIYGRALASVSGSGTNTVVLDFGGSAPFAANAIGTLVIASSTKSVSDGAQFANGTVSVTDGQPPRVNSFGVQFNSNSGGATLAAKDDAVSINYTSTKTVKKTTLTVEGRSITPTGSGTGPFSVAYNKQASDVKDAVVFSIYLEDDLGNNTTLNGTLTFNGTTVSAGTPVTAPVVAAKPAITQVTPVPENNAPATPSYTFNSATTGIIKLTGDCATATSQAVVGNNTITFNALAAGTHNNCTLTVTDSTGQVSNTIFIPSFTVGSGTPTVTAPSSPAAPATSAPTGYTFTKFLKKGMSGNEVLELQKWLAANGYLTATPNGYFGNATEAGVKQLQKDKGLDQFGYVGPGTRAVLNGAQ